jgi:signal transduction histidine kinase/ligand-binding sensor domain-containing protein
MAAMTRHSFCWLTWAWGLVLVGPVAAQPGAPAEFPRTQQYRVTNWTTEQGLPQNTVTCVLQTRDGYLWCGTRYGLVRFDGVRFTSFANELSALATETLDVRSLAEDTQGRLWLQSRTTLVCLEQGRFTQVQLPETPLGRTLQGVAPADRGGLWVVKLQGVERWSDGRVAEKLHTSDVPATPPGYTDRIVPASQARLWVRLHGRPDAVWWLRWDPQTGKTESLTNLIGLAADDIGGLLEDRRGRLWLGRPGELLCWADGRLMRHATPAAWRTMPVAALAEDGLGNIWLATYGHVQLHRFDGQQFASFDQATGLAGAEDVRCLRLDREGNLWVGSGSGGLARIQHRPVVALLTGSYTTQGEVYSVTQGAEGRVWLGTSYGVVCLQDGQFTVFTNTAARAREGWQAPTRMALESPDGTPWVGFDWGVWKLRGTEFIREKLPPLDGGGGRIVTSMLQDRQGTLWVGTVCGLVEHRGSQSRLWSTNDGLSDARVFGLAEGRDGSIWAGTQRGGVNRFHQGRVRAYSTNEGLLSREAWPLRVEADGTVWVGTPQGLNRIREGQVRSVTQREGLFDNLAYCLLEDRQARYWSFCNRGIWRVKKAELHAVADGHMALLSSVNYGESDGMASAEGNGDQQPNAAALANGDLWFPTTRGVVIVDPDKLRDNEVAPGVIIEEVRVDDETVLKDGCNAGLSVPPGPVRLSAGRGRVVELRYTATTFVDPELARFRHRLEGHETQWHEARTRREALYTNLRPGNYRFRVEAANRHGVWSKAPAEIAFSLAPHFYQTWPFYAVLGLVFAAALGGWHHRRLRARERVLHWEQERALQEERGRIAKDLHDDLGANLTGMAMQLEAARRHLGRIETAELQLQSVAESARSMVERMREVVWSLNPQCDTLESFCAFISEFAESFLQTGGLRCRLDLPDEPPDYPLSAEVRHHLVLVVKEALHNAARHAAATEVHVGLVVEDATLRLSIADNGCGFRPVAGTPSAAGSGPHARGANHVPRGAGLVNMRRRVESLGGRFALASEFRQGTQITVSLPLRAKA